eukprot:symbB.v1.2.016609.t1/scaffold1266.1/size127780/4
MGSCQSNAAVGQQIHPLLPMWVLSVHDFLSMDLPIAKHEELFANGKLSRRKSDDYCIFVSHQWISSSHPDPTGQQLGVLQKCLRKLCDGSIDVVNDPSSQFLGDYKRMTKTQRARVRDGYIWLDWISIPQDCTTGLENDMSVSSDDEEDNSNEPPNTASPRSSFLSIPGVTPNRRSPSKSEGSTPGSSPPRSSNSTVSNRSFRFRSPGRKLLLGSDQEKYIQSIPSFVQACQVFVALVPQVRHFETHDTCNFSSWFTRGWCRAEMWCKMLLGNQDMPIVVISAADVADFARPVNWVDCLPHEGHFSFSTDRQLVQTIFEQMLDYKLENLLADGKKALHTYRYFLARKELLLSQRPKRRTLGDFLRDFQFPSIEVAKKTSGMGPVCCAALSGDVRLLYNLLNAGFPAEKVITADFSEIGLPSGFTSTFLAVMQSWRTPDVLQTMLQHQIDPNATTKGVPLLACARTAADVELLVNYRADVHLRAAPLKVPILALASGENKPEAIAKLLECRADPTGPTKGGLGTTNALAFCAFNAASNPHALEVAKLLVKAKTDVNQQCQPGGILKCAEVGCRTYMQFAKPKSTLIMFMAEVTTTPLGFACLAGCSEYVEFLLQARADMNIKNARGHTPLQLAQRQAVKDVLQAYQCAKSQGHELRLEDADLESRWDDREEMPVDEENSWEVPANEYDRFPTL